MEITVRRGNRERFIVRAESSDLVYDLKLRILENQSIGLMEQKLIYEGKVLDNWSTLADYGINDGGRIRLKLPPSRRRVTRASAAQLQCKVTGIEGLVLLIPNLYLLLLVLGPLRRCLSNSKFQIFLQILYVLSNFLISYTIGKMVSAFYYNALIPIWAVLLLKFHGGVDSISVYSIEGNGYAKTHYWILLGPLCLSMICLSFKYHTFWLPLLFCGLTVFKTWERAGALNSSSNGGLAQETSVIADFMKCEHQLSITDFIADGHELESEGESATMAPYNYLVQFEESNVRFHHISCRKIFKNPKEVVTVGKIWQCKGQLLSKKTTEEGDWPLHDLCLSFALFKLLRCRFARYPMPDEAKSRLSRLVHMLLSKHGYQRIFRVIEVELAFLCDSFYTKYPIIFRKGLPVLKVVELLVFIAGCCIAAFILRNYQTEDGHLSGITIFGCNVHKHVTGSVILITVVFEIGQFLRILCSDWLKVTLICCYVQYYSTFERYRFLETTLRCICDRQLFKPYWERALGQYSLLESFDHKPNILLNNSLTSVFMDISRKGQKESARIELHDKVKKAVLFVLRLSRIRKVTNGLTTVRAIDSWLIRNGQPGNNLDWACKLESTAHVILVWHIATSLCDSAPGRKSGDNYIVATNLSEYCAYLVAFCPRLLPDPAHFTECTFDLVVSQAREILKGCNSMESRYERMMGLDPGDDIMRRGATLAKLLTQSVNRDVMWDTLAGFWAEMMVFVAISDDATAHAVYLPKGGEFVTHLWALVYHAGAAKQDWREMDV